MHYQNRARVKLRQLVHDNRVINERHNVRFVVPEHTSGVVHGGVGRLDGFRWNLTTVVYVETNASETGLRL